MKAVVVTDFAQQLTPIIGGAPSAPEGCVQASDVAGMWRAAAPTPR